MAELLFRLDMVSNPLLQDLGLWETAFSLSIPKQYLLSFGSGSWFVCQMYREDTASRWYQRYLSNACAEGR